MQGNAGLPKGRIDKHFDEGCLFVTYSTLISQGGAHATESEAEPTYSVIKGSRLEQVIGIFPLFPATLSVCVGVLIQHFVRAKCRS